jgi:hypothetical protein
LSADVARGVLLAGGAVAAGGVATVLWRRSARTRGQIRTSEYVTRWAGLILVLAFCAAGAVLGVARALGGSPPRAIRARHPYGRALGIRS